ncbi:Iron-sulfur cluster assembly scaffold protein IscU/NifU-like [hydrothermal vent metagenome]|uniref:Iron-sulfur cluster assembly scaffold protein IscU/NifU-like n=1 Tax=hydrothermal vent metagenome TaxID=652676 RepID=A0A1W1CGJ5_9ZZZZ
MTVDAQLIEHMMEPKNYGTLEEANSQGIGKNPNNGEKVIIYLKVIEDEGEDVIEDIAFQAIGCSTTIVAGSMITQEARGLSFIGAVNLIGATMKILEQVPPEDAACSEMVALALKASLETYIQRKTDKDYPIVTHKISNNCVVKEEDTINE